MNKRIEQTINKLYLSLKNVAKDKLYDDIIIQDILDDAKTSRSTYYKYFKAKDDLVLYMFRRIFKHSFNISEDSDKISISKEDFVKGIANIFLYVYSESSLITSIFNSKNNSKLFIEINTALKPYIQYGLEKGYFKQSTLPNDLHLKHLLNDFTFFTFVWVNENFKTNYKTIGNYYIQMNLA